MFAGDEILFELVEWLLFPMRGLGRGGRQRLCGPGLTLRVAGGDRGKSDIASPASFSKYLA